VDSDFALQRHRPIPIIDSLKCGNIHISKQIDRDVIRTIVPAMSIRNASSDSPALTSRLALASSLLFSFAGACSNGQTTGAASDDAGYGGASSGNTSSGTGSGTTSNGGGGGNVGGGSSSSGNAPSSAYADGGIACGFAGGCAPDQACCYGGMTGGGNGGGMGFGFPGGPGCTAQGSCSGSEFDCTSTMHCTGSQVCCFAFASNDAGTGGGGGAFPGFGAAQGFSAHCADSCPTGDMVHYQLCASASECPSGQSCIPGMYTTYCATARAPGADGGGGGGPADASGDVEAQDGGDP
jgi:hypothetical protein